MQAIAQKMGLSPQVLTSRLSQLLPQVVDKVTPDGTVPQSGDALQSAIGMRGGLFK